jgi:cytochrome c oxidase subunit 2
VNLFGICAAIFSVAVAARPGHPPPTYSGNAMPVPPMRIDLTRPDAGKHLMAMQGCFSCHSDDGSRLVGPSLRDVAGSTVTLADASTVVADDAYLRDSILHPQRQLVRGFGPAMPSYAGRLDEPQVAAIVRHLRSISVHEKNLATPATQPIRRD